MPEHDWHHFKLHWLTGVGRLVLPSGYWKTNTRRELAGQAPQGVANREVNLTYDDGPSPHTTSKLIELLDREGIKATFFFIGQNIARNKSLVAEVHAAGHIVANHSFSHPFMPLLSRRRMALEIDRTSDLIEEITGSRPHLFRPPYGIIDGRGAALLQQRRLSAVYWGAVTDDWRNPGADVVVAQIMQRLPVTPLIVMHEGHVVAEQCLAASREIISRVKAEGYHFTAIK